MTVDTSAVGTRLRVTAGERTYSAVLERAAAPSTCAAFEALLPFRSKLIHARWCGEAMWIPLGDLDLGIDYENATSHPVPGQVLVYPGRLSETEILIPYGGARFSSKVGPLAGNHFLTILDGLEDLVALGEQVLWSGAREIVIERVEG